MSDHIAGAIVHQADTTRPNIIMAACNQALHGPAQESTESAAMLSSSSREGAQGTTIYTYDYKVLQSLSLFCWRRHH